jgi:hypothetical protein
MLYPFLFILLYLVEWALYHMASDTQILGADVSFKPVGSVAEDGNVAEDIKLTDTLNSFGPQRLLWCKLDCTIKTSQVGSDTQ